jgi:hypothetical protein
MVVYKVKIKEEEEKIRIKEDTFKKICDKSTFYEVFNIF